MKGLPRTSWGWEEADRGGGQNTFVDRKNAPATNQGENWGRLPSLGQGLEVDRLVFCFCLAASGSLAIEREYLLGSTNGQPFLGAFKGGLFLR